MLKIDRDTQSFVSLNTPKMADVSITERYDLQEFISNSPDAFFKEISQELFVVGKEIEPSNNVQDRIDLLAVDKEGSCVVIELKRGTHKLHLLQALSYAAMVSQWEADDLFQLLSEDRQETLTDFLEIDRDQINRQQRVILIAEAYDYALLVAAEWLSERYGVDIICCRIAVAVDPATSSEYLACSIVYPAPELAKESVPRGGVRIKKHKLKWANWETALASVDNASLVSFYEQQLQAERESYLRRRILHYRIDGKRRWFVAARRNKAYVWQQGRFEGDLAFWSGGVSQPNDVKPVDEGQCLSFFLATNSDFQFFHDAATEKLKSKTWTQGIAENEIDEPEASAEDEDEDE